MEKFNGRASFAVLLGAGSILSGGCSTETTESTNIATPGIWAGVNIDADRPNDTSVNVELNVGGRTGTSIRLDGIERLEASVGGVTKVLTEDTDLFDVDYEANFANSSSADPFRITFFREDGSINSGTTVFLPDEFTITSPASGQTFTTQSILPINWAPGRAGQTIEFLLTAQCNVTGGGNQIRTTSITTVDDGSENYSLVLFTELNDQQLIRPQACELSLLMTRSQTGTLDPAFESGGEVNATQSRVVENMSISLLSN